MSNSFFAFKQFVIHQDRCAMKVGTDGMLLGAWSDVAKAGRVLDAGTGTGLIAIMLAQRSKAIIDAVEIDGKACIQATENIAACPWKESISIYCDSLQHFIKITTNRYDVVVSNPPYFRNSLKPPSASRSLARHNDQLSHESLLFCTSQVLAPQGRLTVIIPAGEISRMSEMAYFHGLFLSRLVRIKALPERKPSRCLAEFTTGRNKSCEESTLVIREHPNSYSAEFKELTKDYYL